MAALSRPFDNRDRLVVVAAGGRVAPPAVFSEAFRIDRDGRAFLLPGTGGIYPDVHVGDVPTRLLADHLMVGASVVDASAPPSEPGAFHLLACVGNRVRSADGSFLGIVAGKRGGLAPGFLPPSLVSVEAPSARLEHIAPGASVVAETVGRGLELVKWPDVLVMNIAPVVLDALPLGERDGRLEVGVRATVPSRAAGAGIGQDAWVGDIEIMESSLSSPRSVELAFGDLVAFDGIDARYGRYYRPDTISIGLVSHGPSSAPGHGIGVTMLMAGPTDRLVSFIDDGASLAPVLRELAGTDTASPHSPRRRAHGSSQGSR